MNISEQIKTTRLALKEGQWTFGKRFGVSETAVSLWEQGKREAPYKVLEFVLGNKVTICSKCKGSGYILKKKV